MLLYRTRLVGRALLGLSVLALVIILSGCAGTRPDIAIPDMPPSPTALKNPPDIVLVLGGGGARGYAHVGVLHELEKAHIPIDMVVGTSAGSIMGAVYADTGSVASLENVVMNATLWDYADIANFPLFGGVVQGYHLQKFLIQNMHSRVFSQMKVKFIAVSTDLMSGETYVIQSGPVAPAVLASAAVPGVVKPVHLYGRILVDGGVTDNVAVDIARRFHPKMIIAVDVGSSLTGGLPNSSFGIIARSYDITLDKLTGLQLLKADIIIHPDIPNIGMFDLSHKYDLVNSGQAAAYKMLPSIRKMMREKGIAPAG